MTVSAGGYMQLALEHDPNGEGGANAVSTNTFYHPSTEVDIKPNPVPLERKDELRGGFWANPHSGAGSYAPDGTITERMYPAAIGQLLFAALGLCTSVQGVAGPSVLDPDGAQIPSGAYRHVFALKTGDVPQTFQAIYGPPSGSQFEKAQGLGIDELSFSSHDAAWWAVAKILGLVAKPISDPSLTPAYETATPFREGQLALTWLSGSAVTEDFSWSIKPGIKVERQYTNASLFPDAIVFDDPLPTLGGAIPKRSLDPDDYNAFIGGTTFAALLKYTHSENAVGSYKHKLWVEMPACQYVNDSRDGIKNERRNKASFDWEARYDTVTGKWFTITLVNATPKYDQY